MVNLLCLLKPSLFSIEIGGFFTSHALFCLNKKTDKRLPYEMNLGIGSVKLMDYIRTHRRKFLLFLAVCFTVFTVSYLTAVSVLPSQITLIEGQEYVYNFKSPFLVVVKADKQGILKLNDGDIKVSGSYLQLLNPISMKTQKRGSVNLRMKLFGLFPLKTMKVDIVPNKKVVACGNTVGVKLTIEGILVIGVSDVETPDGKKVFPTRESGIKPGDFITEINNVKLKSIDNLKEVIEKSKGANVKLKYKRGNTFDEAEIKPVISADDNLYHIGLWVRDSTAGIGTLTFYDPETKYFGALGHGITDIDTGTLMPIENGEILESNILGIKKGKQGVPGELKGVFLEDRNKLGVIKANSDCGIYGVLNIDAINRISSKVYPIGLRNQIKEGKATILANIDGKNVDEYEIEIQKVSRQNLSGTKGMVIKIVDKRLLDATGGIVQGMSGSPIIQDKKIIGAVTHVLLSRPDTGYGIFIESMLKNMPVQNQQPVEKAG